MQGRLVVILHAVGNDSLRSVGYLAVIGFVLQLFAEIALIEAVVVGHVVYEGIVVGFNYDEVFGVGEGWYQHHGRGKCDKWLFQYHG